MQSYYIRIMKFYINYFLITVFLISISFNFVNAQKIKGELILGVNATQIDGDEVYGYHKFGLNTGVGAILPFGKHWSLSVETILNQKGAYQNESIELDTLPTPYYNIRLNYVEVPVMIHYEDKQTITGGIGFSWGRTVGITEIEHGTKVPTTTLASPYKRDDVNLLLDVRFRIWKKLKFNFRYAYSIFPIRTRIYTNSAGNSWERTQYNSLLTFRLIYVFNEAPDLTPKAIKEK
jgi:hypothetical protein